MNLKLILTNHKKTVMYVVLSILLLLGLAFYVKWQNVQLRDLQVAYEKNQARLEILQTLSQEYLTQIEDQKKVITTLQKERDRVVKEAVKNAYIKGSSISDSDVLDAWNDTIIRARKRNAERKNNIAND